MEPVRCVVRRARSAGWWGTSPRLSSSLARWLQRSCDDPDTVLFACSHASGALAMRLPAQVVVPNARIGLELIGRGCRRVWRLRASVEPPCSLPLPRRSSFIGSVPCAVRLASLQPPGPTNGAGEDVQLDWVTANRQSGRCWNEASCLPSPERLGARRRTAWSSRAWDAGLRLCSPTEREGAAAISRRHPDVRRLVANWLTRCAGGHVAVPVPAAAQVRREFRGAKRTCPTDDGGSFSVGGADDSALEVRGTHPEC